MRVDLKSKITVAIVSFFALLASRASHARTSMNLDSETAAQICTNCLDSSTSDQGSPLASRNLEMLKNTTNILRLDIAKKTRNHCENIVESRSCRNLYAEIQKNHHNPNQYKRTCTEQAPGQTSKETLQFVETIFLGTENPVRKKMRETERHFFVGFGRAIYRGTVGFAVNVYKNYEAARVCDHSITDKKRFFYNYNANRPKDLQVKLPSLAWFNTETCSGVEGYIQMMGTELYTHKLSKEGVKFKSVGSEIPHDIKTISIGVYDQAKQELKRFHVKLECYNSQKRSELIGAAVGMIALNVTPVGDAKKAEEIAEIAGVGENIVVDASTVSEDAAKAEEASKAAPITTNSATVAAASAREKEIYSILKEMNELKHQPASAENLKKLKELNDKAIQITAEELKTRGISFKVVNPKAGGGNFMHLDALQARQKILIQRGIEMEPDIKYLRSLEETRAKYRKLLSDTTVRKQQLATEIEDTGKQLDKLSAKGSEYDKKLRQVLIERRKRYSDLYRELDRNQTDIKMQLEKTEAEVGRQQNKIKEMANAPFAPVLKSSELKYVHTWNNPYIVITPSPTNPKFLNAAIEKYNTEIVISPNFKSADPKILGGISRSNRADETVFIYPIEQVFAKGSIVSETAKHEVVHLKLGQLRSVGHETPYNVEITAHKGEKIPGSSLGLYDDYMSFEEMATWNRDLNSAKKSHLTGTTNTAYNFDQGIFRQAGGTATQVQNARALNHLSYSAIKAVRAAREYLDTADPADIPITIKGVDGAGTSTVTVPYLTQGREIGKIKITLVNLTKANKDDAVKLAQEYLDRVEARAKVHGTKALNIIKAHRSAIRAKAWVPVTPN